MRIEEVIGRNMRRMREERALSQTGLGQAIELQQGRPWSRQAVSAAEKGQRAFSAADLMALARVLDGSIASLFLLADRSESSVDLVEGISISADEYQERVLGGLLGGPARTLTAADVQALQVMVRNMRGSHQAVAEVLAGLEASVTKAAQVVQLEPVTDEDITPEQHQLLREQYEQRTGRRLEPDDVVDWVTGELRKR